MRTTLAVMLSLLFAGSVLAEEPQATAIHSRHVLDVGTAAGSEVSAAVAK